MRTAIYTAVSIKQLQEVHTRCHPSAKTGLSPATPDKAVVAEARLG